MNSNKFPVILGTGANNSIKKFQLSLKKPRNVNDENNGNVLNINSPTRKLQSPTDVFGEDTSPAGSQNFKLQVSDESLEENIELDTHNDRNKLKTIASRENSLVIVSDSDDNDRGIRSLSTIRPLLRNRCLHRGQISKDPQNSVSVIVLDSSDSDSDIVLASLDQGSQRIVRNNQDIDGSLTSPYFKRNPLWSSESSSSTHFSPEIGQRRGIDSLHVREVISESSSLDDENREIGNIRVRKKDSSHLSRREKLKTSSCNAITNVSISRVPHNLNVNSKSGCTSMLFGKSYEAVKLTKQDAQRILEGKKSTNNLIPQLAQKLSDHGSETQSTYSNERNRVAEVIDETVSCSSSSSDENDIGREPQPEIHRPTKTHVTRFMNVPPEGQPSHLSERKKNEISQWLAYNSPTSSNSSGIVSESNQNSSYGNSSLERFELQHETPNNRGKISKPSTGQKSNGKQDTLDRFIYRGKTSILKDHTPSRYDQVTPKEQQMKDKTADIPRNGNNRTDKTVPLVTAVQNLDIEDCTDVLDKLYGNIWRNNADAVLTPQTEPRHVQKVVIADKANKTEGKRITHTTMRQKRISSSSEEDEFDVFTKDIRPNFNSTKKTFKDRRTTKSFITNDTSLEDSRETFYTALTNPRESKDNRFLKSRPMTELTKKIISICDSESENEGKRSRIINDRNRRRLSFSGDESNTSTSEFDPGEIVLPKKEIKKKVLVKSNHASRPAIHSASVSTVISDKTKPRSFLASLSSLVPLNDCHPEAKAYRTNYKNKKEDLCKYLFKLYNERIFDNKLPRDMAIEWSVRMRGTAGFCYNKKSTKTLGGITRSSRLVLATKILDTPDRLRDTLVHELCHAAAWLINNVSDGHGPFWKGWANKAMTTFPELPPIKRCHDYKIQTKFTYKCTGCGYSIGRHSKSLDIERKRCGHCYGKFELLINKTSRSGTFKTATPVQTKTPSQFALFVKDNYGSVKKSRRNIKHGEVMKILGQQFSAIKIRKKFDDAET